MIGKRWLSMKPLKEKISITIDSDLLSVLKKQAENDNRSLSQYINLLLKKAMEEKNWNKGVAHSATPLRTWEAQFSVSLLLLSKFDIPKVSSACQAEETFAFAHYESKTGTICAGFVLVI